jgi:lipopolysaccharide transport system ATP-binding protein
MTRSEIGGKFDEIVSFAEIEKFLDTPVKRYSSGMYVRLAFAVAAHLEPEILLVDEVLAVGDAAFQKKCLGKMGNVAQEGRTVLFVSHNMGAIGSLCNRCLLVERGSLTQDGNPSQVTGIYQASLYSTIRDPSDLSGVERYGTGRARFVSAKVIPMGIHVSSQSYLHTGQDLKVELRIKARAEVFQANVALIIYDSAGYRLIDVNTALQGCFLSLKVDEEALVTFYLQDVLLKPGVYLLGLWIGRRSIEDMDGITHATSISVEADPDTLKHSETFPGVYQCRYRHHIEKVES